MKELMFSAMIICAMVYTYNRYRGSRTADPARVKKCAEGFARLIYKIEMKAKEQERYPNKTELDKIEIYEAKMHELGYRLADHVEGNPILTPIPEEIVNQSPV